MSGVIGPQYQGGYTIPNPSRPPADPQPRAVYGLRATPPIFSGITRAGNGNFTTRMEGSFFLRGPIYTLAPYRGPIIAIPPVPTLKELFASISGAGAVTAQLVRQQQLTASVVGFATVLADLITDREIFPVDTGRANYALRSLRRRRRDWKEWES